MIKTNLPKEDFKVAESLKEENIKKLVEKFIKIKKTIEVLEKDAEIIKGELVDYANHRELNILEGENNAIFMNTQDIVSFKVKKDRKKLNEFIKSKGYWNMFSELDKNKLLKSIKDKKFKNDESEFIESFLNKKTIIRFVLDIGKQKMNKLHFNIINLPLSKEKLELNKLKYDTKKELFKSRHSVFKNYYSYKFELKLGDTINNHKEIETYLIKFLDENIKVLIANLLVFETYVFIFVAGTNNFEQYEFLEDLRKKLLIFNNFNEGELSSIPQINESFIKEFVEKNISGENEK